MRNKAAIMVAVLAIALFQVGSQALAGKDPEFPVTPNAQEEQTPSLMKKGSFDITE